MKTVIIMHRRDIVGIKMRLSSAHCLKAPTDKFKQNSQTGTLRVKKLTILVAGTFLQLSALQDGKA